MLINLLLSFDFAFCKYCLFLNSISSSIGKDSGSRSSTLKGDSSTISGQTVFLWQE